MRVTYRPRATARALALQYFHYGRWRRVVARQHAGTINLRYLAPPAAVAVIAAGQRRRAGRAGRTGRRRAPPGRALASASGCVIPVTYAGRDHRRWPRSLARDVPLGVRARLPVVLATMHMCWGAGFLTSSRGLLRRMARPAGD